MKIIIIFLVVTAVIMAFIGFMGQRNAMAADETIGSALFYLLAILLAALAGVLAFIRWLLTT